MSDSFHDLFDGFTELVESTACPYARLADIHFIPVAYASGATDFLETFRMYQSRLGEPKTDAVIVAIGLSELGESIDEHARTFRQLLQLLSGPSMSSDVLKPGWQLQIHQTRVFATMFSPIYPADNPRAISNGRYGYVMLQPEHSFHRLLPRDRLEPGQRMHIKSSIRDAFDRAGMPYDALDRDPPTEAQKYVKPLHIGDSMIEWWKA
jgi:hypothetical protein